MEMQHIPELVYAIRQLTGAVLLGAVLVTCGQAMTNESTDGDGFVVVGTVLLGGVMFALGVVAMTSRAKARPSQADLPRGAGSSSPKDP
jgi:hypothetical protein